MSHRRNQDWSRSVRRAAVTLELILTFPIWLALLLAMIEFGQILSGQQIVALASRVGAAEAAQTVGLSTNNGDPVPANVLAIIDQQLASAGMTSCRVFVQHNVAAGPPLPVELGSGPCACDSPSTPLPASGQYVRVTVCVELTELTPDLLGFLGFDITNKKVRHSTTYRYEL